MAESEATISAQNRSGQWVPAIPEPFFIGRKKVRCIVCPLVLKDRQRYREHYALQHILDMD
jgi:hypothetical protein